MNHPKQLHDFTQENTYNYELGLFSITHTATGPGYHTKMQPGSTVHPTRPNLRYALELLQTGDPACVERAGTVIAAVISHQQDDPTHDAYGVWPWYIEENCDQMDPPDKNWAPFNSAFLLTMLELHESQLTDWLKTEMKGAILRACYSIFRRNVGSQYTNIALMNAAVTMAAGERYGEEIFFEYGKSLLSHFVDFTREQGSFAEYNSPVYTLVALHEIERILMVVRDEDARKMAEDLHLHAWELISSHYHPATGQWAAPHLRSYSLLLPKGTAKRLSAYTGQSLTWFGPEGEQEQISSKIEDLFWEVDPLPCPEHLLEFFKPSGSRNAFEVTPFTRSNQQKDGFIGSTWMSPNACLGSVNLATTWTQTYSCLGFWLSNGDLYTLRLRVLSGDKDFTSFTARLQQQENHVLGILRPVTGLGNWHPLLDVPSDGKFTTTNLRLSIELTGPELLVLEENETELLIKGGEKMMRLFKGPAIFGGQPGQWQVQQSEKFLALECLLLPCEQETSWKEIVQNSGLGFALSLNAKDEIIAPTWNIGSESWQTEWKVASTCLKVNAGHDPKSW